MDLYISGVTALPANRSNPLLKVVRAIGTRGALPLALLASLLGQPAIAATHDAALHIASFNIHYVVPSDKTDDWPARRDAVTQVINEMDADIIAFQEMETFDGGHYSSRNLQLEWILSTTRGYRAAATGAPQLFPSTQPILYRPERLQALEQGFFFFSDQPDTIYTAQWNGGYPYFCSWVRFRDRANGREFHIFNVHNDYSSRSNRIRASTLIAERVRSIVPPGGAVIVLGDLNAPSGFAEIRRIETAGLTTLPPNGPTHRLFGLHLLPAIDHILVGQAFLSQSDIKVWRSRYQGAYPADHYPISVRLAFRETASCRPDAVPC